MTREEFKHFLNNETDWIEDYHNTYLYYKNLEEDGRYSKVLYIKRTYIIYNVFGIKNIDYTLDTAKEKILKGEL